MLSSSDFDLQMLMLQLMPQLFAKKFLTTDHECRWNINPLSPKSDQHQISPCNINALYNTVVMRITDMITQDEFDWYFINFSPLLLWEMN